MYVWTLCELSLWICWNSGHKVKSENVPYMTGIFIHHMVSLVINLVSSKFDLVTWRVVGKKSWRRTELAVLCFMFPLFLMPHCWKKKKKGIMDSIRAGRLSVHAEFLMGLMSPVLLNGVSMSMEFTCQIEKTVFHTLLQTWKL